MSKLRIGSISYTNTWPVSHFFDINKLDKHVEFIPQVPSQLNRQMAEGLIDIGPISSFSYAEHADKYLLLPNLSVSAYGNVGSISLFVKTDLNDVKNKKIALANTSATSVNLLKIILEEFLEGNPSYIFSQPDLDLMMKQADAALLIGDDALLASWQNEKDKRYKLYDLGDEWLKKTNNWMTFAVWAVRREIIDQDFELLYKVYQEFILSKEEGKKKIEQIIAASISKYGGSFQFWNEYFKGLSHDFNKAQIMGLEHYFKLAYKIGALRVVPDIELVDFKKLLVQS